MTNLDEYAVRDTSGIGSDICWMNDTHLIDKKIEMIIIPVGLCIIYGTRRNI